MRRTTHRERGRHQTLGLWIGSGLALSMLALPAPEGLSAAAWQVAALGLLMGVWWATEANPVAAVAAEAGFAPIALTVPVALAASCAFMLPVATPPNAVVYGSGLLGIPDMVRAGVWLDLIGLLLVSLVAIFLVPLILG